MQLSVKQNGLQFAAVDIFLVTGKFGSTFEYSVNSSFIPSGTFHFLFDSGTFLLFLHGLDEAFPVNGISLFSDDFYRQVDREAVGIVELECQFAFELSVAGSFHIVDVAVDDPQALIDSCCELFFFGMDDLFDHDTSLLKFRISDVRYIDDLIAEFRKERTFNTQFPSVDRSSSDQSSQNVLPAFVSRQDAVSDHEGH